MTITKRQSSDSCELCGIRVSPADEMVHYDVARDDTIILFCELCYQQRKVGKQMPDGSVQLSLVHWLASRSDTL